MQTVIKINQKKDTKYKKLLKNEKNKNIDLLSEIQKYKNELKNSEKEKEYIKTNSLLKFKNMEIEVLEVINQFKTLELKMLNKEISQKKVFKYMHFVLDTLKLEINSFN